MTTPNRLYYSQRTGKNTGKPKMSLEPARRMFSARVSGFEDQGSFQEYFGKPCPDNRSPGRLGGDVEGAILLRLNKTDLWPVEPHWQGTPRTTCSTWSSSYTTTAPRARIPTSARTMAAARTTPSSTARLVRPNTARP